MDASYTMWIWYTVLIIYRQVINMHTIWALCCGQIQVSFTQILHGCFSSTGAIMLYIKFLVSISWQHSISKPINPELFPEPMFYCVHIKQANPYDGQQHAICYRFSMVVDLPLCTSHEAWSIVNNYLFSLDLHVSEILSAIFFKGSFLWFGNSMHKAAIS